MYACPICGNKDLKIMVDVTVAIHSKYINRLSKRAFRSKDIKFCNVN